MAAFVFKLHGVLRHREMIEQEKQRAFALAQAERAAAQVEIKRLDETVQQALADLRANHLTGSLDLSFLAAHRRFMLAMQRQGLVLMQKLQAAQKKGDAAKPSLRRRRSSEKSWRNCASGSTSAGRRSWRGRRRRSRMKWRCR